MKSIYRIVLLAVLFTVIKVEAQQDPNYSFYGYNMNLINPSFAGTGEKTNLGLNMRSQWAGVKGAPQTQSLFFGSPVGNKVGLGVSIISDKTFIESQTSIAADFSYKLQLNDELNLYFGIKAGFNSYDVNTDGLISYGIGQDASLMNLDGRFYPNIGAGAHLRHEDYFVSFSIPKLLTPDRLEEDNGIARLGTDKLHMYFSGGYVIRLNGGMELKPMALVRYVDASPLSIDLTTILTLNSFFDIGAAYRLDEGMSGLFIFKVSPNFELGYAYEAAFENPVRNSSNGTHELMMNFKL